MSFGISKQKRLARRNPIEAPMDRSTRTSKMLEKAPPSKPKPFLGDPHLTITASDLKKELTITPYSERSFIVMGSGTHDHSEALVSLGGKYTQLRIGTAWLFPKIKQETVQHYIDTGEVKPYVYSQSDKDRFERRNIPDFDIKQKLREIFKEFRDAFDKDEDYEGASIIDVIDQLEEKHLGVQKITATPRLSKPVVKEESNPPPDPEESNPPPDPEESNSLSSEELSSEESE